MRVVSHTCSNTEIACALDCADWLVGVDDDSDFPLGVVHALPKLGRDLELDVDAVITLRPDLVLTSLTVPGHERIVDALRAAGLPLLVIDPVDLDGVFNSILEIAKALGVLNRGRSLVARMQSEMPPIEVKGDRPGILVEWWPKPVIAPGRQSWVNALLERAGSVNPWADREGKSVEVSTEDACNAAPDAIVMSWCGVKEEKYRAEVVTRRAGWSSIPAIASGQVHPVSEAYLGRPGPRLVKGYRALRRIIESTKPVSR